MTAAGCKRGGRGCRCSCFSPAKISVREGCLRHAYVEIDAHQHALAGDIDVGEGGPVQRHGGSEVVDVGRCRSGCARRLVLSSTAWNGDRPWPMADDVAMGGIGSLRAPC
eukprot:1124082-Prymnesium_polylepis.2